MPYATPDAYKTQPPTNPYLIGKGPAGPNPGTGSLGLNLGLGAKGREGFRNAAAGGNLDTFLADRGLDRRYENALNASGGRGARAQAFQGANAGANAAAGAAAANPSGAAAAPNGKMGGPTGSTPTAPAHPTGPPVTPPGGPSFAERLAQMFGPGNPFGAQDWYGGNPLKTASDLANQQLGENLAGIRERYGANGLGNSDRGALAEGTALAQSATGLGDVLASRGQEARNADISRLMQGMLSGEQLAQNREQMPINALNTLNQAGAGLSDLQTNEINSPLIGMLMSFLTGYSPTTTASDQWSRVRTT